MVGAGARWLLAVVAVLASCRAVDVGQVDVYACAADGSCSAGDVCCDDRFCREACASRDGGVTDGGVCTDGDICTTNPNPCRAGYAVCATRSCNDSAAVIRSPGESCGVDRTCDSSGTCHSCSTGAPCSTNLNQCRGGITGCTTGRPVCSDDALLDAGLRCGTAGVCSATGVCSECPPSSACSTNPTACFTGLCRGATGVCDDGLPKPVLSACDGGLCNGAGGCVVCAVGAACTTNPGAPCQRGQLQLDGSGCRCVSAGAAANGTGCDGGICTGGVCAACAVGAECGTDCAPGLLQASDAGCLCQPQKRPPNGSFCPGGVCAMGACCTGCTSSNQATCYAGDLLANCGSKGDLCSNCEMAPAYGPCQYVDICAITGSRTIYESICSNNAVCQFVRRGLSPNDPVCARVTDNIMCAGSCGTFECGAMCGGGTCTVSCGGACRASPSPQRMPE